MADPNHSRTPCLPNLWEDGWFHLVIPARLEPKAIWGGAEKNANIMFLHYATNANLIRVMDLCK